MTHTPGPWRAVSTEIVSLSLPDDDCVVADVLSEDYKADASLIAAAPELLAALREMVMLRCLGGATPENDSPTQKAVLAIAKAEGRTDEE